MIMDLRDEHAMSHDDFVSSINVIEYSVYKYLKEPLQVAVEEEVEENLEADLDDGVFCLDDELSSLESVFLI